MKMTGTLSRLAMFSDFVECALVDRAVAEEAEGDAAGLLVPLGEGEAEAERDVPADDAVAAHVADLGVEEVHRAALALGAAGRLAEELRHRGARAHAQRQAVAVAAVAVDQVVLALLEDGGDADGDGFLAAVEVAEPADLHGPSGSLRRSDTP